jgi:colanic acid/amylovoran biosynthesis glycosyltransferase
VDLVLFTGSYPYDDVAEQTFLNQEVEYLTAAFERVIIVPENCEGQKYPLPSEIQVEEGYSAFLKSQSRMTIAALGLTSPLLVKELITIPTLISQPKAMKRLLSWVGHAELGEKWVLDFIKTKRVEVENCIFYTYWFGQTSTAIGLLKRLYTKIILVSRSHGSDMYEERHNPAYIPCRQISLKMLNGLFPASENGTRYMKQKYSKIVGRCETAHLGVNDPGFLTHSSNDGIWRIVSCSYVAPIKRLDLLLRGIAYAANTRPLQSFKWTHIGDRYWFKQLKDMAAKELPPNVTWNFPGYLPPQDIMKFYRNNPVDVFMQVSQSEGGASVSIQEAISCGIPIIATGVGGTPEIVSDKNGLLLSENPSVQEISDAICYLIDHPVDVLNKKSGSRQVWQNKYNSTVNFPSFVEKIKSIRNVSDTRLR